MANKGAQIGDVFEITTPAGLAYIQYTNDDPGLGQLIRILPGLHPSPPDVKTLVTEKERYYVFYPLHYALRDGHVRFVSRESLPSWAVSFPIMRKRSGEDQNGRTTGWLLGDGSRQSTLAEIAKLLYVKDEDLTLDQRKLSIGCEIWPPPVLVKRLVQGWVPEREEEFRQQDIAEASKKVQTREKGPQVLDHYLYFPKKYAAEEAAKILRDKGWVSEVKMGADGENWLVLSKQPAPIDEGIEEVRDELENLAERFGGEYDGWGAAV